MAGEVLVACHRSQRSREGRRIDRECRHRRLRVRGRGPDWVRKGGSIWPGCGEGYLFADGLDLSLGDDLEFLEHGEVLIDVVHAVENRNGSDK